MISDFNRELNYSHTFSKEYLLNFIFNKFEYVWKNKQYQNETNILNLKLIVKNL